MGACDQYMTQGKIFARQELAGEPLDIDHTDKTTRYRGKDWPTACTRWKGLHQVRFGEESFLADESMVFDSGPKLGVTVVVARHPDRPATEAERAAGREEVCRKIGAIFGCRCYWNNEGGAAHVGEVTKEAPQGV